MRGIVSVAVVQTSGRRNPCDTMRHGIKSPRKTGTKTMDSGDKIRVLTAEAMSALLGLRTRVPKAPAADTIQYPFTITCSFGFALWPIRYIQRPGAMLTVR